MWCHGNRWRWALSLAGTALLLGCGGTTKSSPQDLPPDSSARCVYDGRTYRAGDDFAAQDGCNACSCGSDGTVACTERGCETCQSIAARYGSLMELARACDPAAVSNPCSERVFEGLQCGCDAFVTASAWNQSEADALQRAFSAMNCGAGIACGPCASPSRGYCSDGGVCVNDYEPEPEPEPEPGPGCKVNGVVYPDGASNVPDPVSCNVCACQAGELACDDQACPKPCPVGTAFGRSCAACGPTDACLVVEVGCLPACTNACDAGLCSDGVCVSFCG